IQPAANPSPMQTAAVRTSSIGVCDVSPSLTESTQARQRKPTGHWTRHRLQMTAAQSMQVSLESS
ncbi:MAG TPA: hypothetical protein V6D17_11175, partial [Candidatus Obscuribacterales bacterium]